MPGMEGDNATRPFRVLSIDGGGMRGVYTAAYLDGLATAFAKRRAVGALDIGRAFDLIVGTSTGAFIAWALALGVAPHRIVTLYRKHGAAVFPTKMPATKWAFLRSLTRIRSKDLADGEAALRGALEELFENTTVIQAYQARGIAVSVPAVELSQRRAWVFKTPHLGTSFHRDDNCTLVDVCLASSAAPLYRSVARSANNQYFVDGGLWANNPVLVGLVDALEMLAARPAESARPLEIFSLGTCPRPEGTFLDADDTHWEFIRWRFGGLAAQFSISAQEYAFDHMARLLTRHVGRPCTTVRFPHGPVSAELAHYLDLDEVRDKGMASLIAQAAADVNVTTSACTSNNHREGQAIARLFEDMPAYEEE